MTTTEGVSPLPLSTLGTSTPDCGTHDTFKARHVTMKFHPFTLYVGASEGTCMFSLHLILLTALLIAYTTVSTVALSVNNQHNGATVVMLTWPLCLLYVED
jgi:hypothetical protein